ncbi:hypothetical protein [Hymenobacter persicinus]|uniref:hypothetical protein n=1 Tax=Hymenobacter persicinus TaxID=2025506 RepID=UPI001F5D4FD2|nr:hypothetical protein [Hymenobacter persicinus]
MLCFAGAYLSSHYGQDDAVLLQADVARLQALVVDAERTAEQEAEEVAGRLLEGQVSFTSLVGRTTYPCFIFRGDQLWYWSDHTIQPEPENVGQHFEEKLVDMKFGKFLALRRLAGPYTILTYVPLEKHYGISNRYLKEGEENALFRGLNVRLVAGIPGGRALPKIYSDEGNYLFSVESVQANPVTGKYLPLLLLLLGFGLYLWGWLQRARQLLARGEVLMAAAAVVVPLGAFRVALLYFGLPFSFIEVPLFDPRVYAASWLAPSLGDLLINALLLLLGLLRPAAVSALRGRALGTPHLRPAQPGPVRRHCSAAVSGPDGAAVPVLRQQLRQLPAGARHHPEHSVQRLQAPALPGHRAAHRRLPDGVLRVVADVYFHRAAQH